MRYWGFRRVHGAIWAQLYLSRSPLSCTDLVNRLGLSKALISPALEELLFYKVIEESPSPNGKTRLYVAASDINEAIQRVLKTRESAMLKQITKDFSAFELAASKDENVDLERVQSMGGMILSANLMLEILLSQKDVLNLPMEIKL